MVVRLQVFPMFLLQNFQGTIPRPPLPQISCEWRSRQDQTFLAGYATDQNKLGKQALKSYLKSTVTLKRRMQKICRMQKIVYITINQQLNQSIQSSVFFE